MKKLIIIILFPIILFSQDKKSEEKAIQNSINWLTKLDNSQYFESWESGSIHLQEGIEQYRWASAMKISREPFGNIISRELNSINHTTKVSGLPDGEYLIIEFNVSYEHRDQAIEKTISVKEKDNTWKVARYIIK